MAFGLSLEAAMGNNRNRAAPNDDLLLIQITFDTKLDEVLNQFCQSLKLFTDLASLDRWIEAGKEPKLSDQSHHRQNERNPNLYLRGYGCAY